MFGKGSTPLNILGYELVLVNALPASPVSGDAILIFGDGEGYNVGIDKELDFLVSDTLGSGFMNYARQFR